MSGPAAIQAKDPDIFPCFEVSEGVRFELTVESPPRQISSLLP